MNQIFDGLAFVCIVVSIIMYFAGDTASMYAAIACAIVFLIIRDILDSNIWRIKRAKQIHARRKARLGNVI